MDLDSASASQGRAGPTRENRRGKIRDPLGKQETIPTHAFGFRRKAIK